MPRHLDRSEIVLNHWYSSREFLPPAMLNVLVSRSPAEALRYGFHSGDWWQYAVFSYTEESVTDYTRDVVVLWSLPASPDNLPR